MDGPLRPGSVVFVETPDGVTHRDYVTHAWTDNPVKEVLVKMASTPALTRIAASARLLLQPIAFDRASRAGFAPSHWSCVLAKPRVVISVASASATKAIAGIADAVKQFARIQHAADRRTDGLSDIEHRRY